MPVAPSRLALLVAAALLAGCGRKAPDADAAGTPDGAEVADSGSADTGSAGTAAAAAGGEAEAAKPGGPASITPGAVDRYREGLEAEVALHEELLRRLKAARTGTDSLEVLGGVIGGETEQKAAEKVGLPLDRYRTIKTTIGQALGARQMGQSPLMKEMAATDTSDFTAEQKAQVRQNLKDMQTAWGDPFKGFPPETAKKLAGEAAALDTLQARLLALKFKAAGR